MTTLDTGDLSIADQPPPDIEELIDVIRKITVLIKEQARDLSRSKRLRRLISSFDASVIAASVETAGRPALLHWLSQVGTIVEPLEREFIDQLRDAFSSNPSRFEDLGLTSNSAAWHLKQAGFAVAQAHAEQAPPWYKTDDGKVLYVIEERETVFKIGDSVIGTSLVAVPVAGSYLSEGYKEIKENVEALGGIAKKGASGGAAGAKAVGRGLVKVVTWPWRRGDAPVPQVPVIAER